MMDRLDNKSKLLIKIIIICLFISIVSTSYAYFTSIVNSDSNINVIQSGSMRLTFQDGPVVTKSNMLPGDSFIKTFKVKNTGTLETSYDVYFSELINTFVNTVIKTIIKF